MNTEQLKYFMVSEDDRGVATFTLDVPNRPMNVFNREVMRELGELVEGLQSRTDLAMAIFRSGKDSGFLAGADVRVIRELTDSAEADALLLAGQQIFARVEQLPMHTLAVIHGPCLGGGLEFALACDYRIARDNSSTQIGLPEIKLGLIPGWGGTQRLPRQIGMRAALELILSGRSLDARKAERLGLVDRAIAADAWSRGVENFVTEVLQAGKLTRTRARRSIWQRLCDQTSLGRQVIVRLAERRLAERAERYPALPAAIKAVQHAYLRGGDGYECERLEFGRLLQSTTARNLIDVFLMREAARDLQTWVTPARDAIHEPPIRNVGIVGAGAMGAGIGQFAASRGFDVHLVDVSESAAREGRERVKRLFNQLAKRRGWSAAKLDEALRRVTVGCSVHDLANCDLVIEAVVENPAIKRDVFASLDGVVQSSALLTTNTSSLSVEHTANATKRGANVAGLHFFNPVHRMDLVEVIAAPATSQRTLTRLIKFVRALGKTPVVTSDEPGFLVNRILFPYLGEAVMMAREGIDVLAIDREAKRFGMPMGPLELLDQVGLDVALHVARSLRGVLGEAGMLVDPLAIMSEHERLGQKSGIGFYHYHGGRIGGVANLPVGFRALKKQNAVEGCLDDGLNAIQRRTIYPILAEAVRCVEQQITRHSWAIDLAMVLGTGFAPQTGGPLHFIDTVGPDVVLNNLNRLAQTYGARFAPPSSLAELVHEHRHFMDSKYGRDRPNQTSA